MAQATTSHKRFNRFDALLSEVDRLQLSKLKLLQNASQEMQKLRTFIRFLSKIDGNPNLSPQILKEIKQFNSHSTINNNNSQNDNILQTSIEFYHQQYASSNFVDLQKEIKRLRQAKIQLLKSTNTEINAMRDTVKLLMNRIILRINPNSKNIQITNKMQQQSINALNTNEKLLHNYKLLGKDNVINIMIMGTACSGKSVLLRTIINLYVPNSNILKSIKNIQYSVINSIIYSIYNVLYSNEFFLSSKYKLNLSDNMKIAIKYFKQNRLCKYDGPYLTKDIVKHITNIFTSNNDNNDDEYVRLSFKNDCFYRNMYYFYLNIDKYSLKNWYQTFTFNELLLIWDTSILPVYYYDIQINQINQLNDAYYDGNKVYRFWDISSVVLYNANTKYKYNLQNIFEYIMPSCIIYVTSPIFTYQIEQNQTSMRRSIDYFVKMFEDDDGDDIKQIDIDDDKDNDILCLAKQKWNLVPIITLFNKCDIFKNDIESLYIDETKSILLTFPQYDDELTYDAIMAYLKVIFKSFKMNNKRPYHIYETIIIDQNKVKTIIHHIQTMTNLYTNNTRAINNTPYFKHCNK